MELHNVELYICRASILKCVFQGATQGFIKKFQYQVILSGQREAARLFNVASEILMKRRLIAALLMVILKGDPERRQTTNCFARL